MPRDGARDGRVIVVASSPETPRTARDRAPRVAGAGNKLDLQIVDTRGAERKTAGAWSSYGMPLAPSRSVADRDECGRGAVEFDRLAHRPEPAGVFAFTSLFEAV